VALETRVLPSDDMINLIDVIDKELNKEEIQEKNPSPRNK